MAYVIVEPCVDVKDGACVDVCPVDCIYPGADQFYIHPVECIDCACCAIECPVDAIFYERDLEFTRRWLPYQAKNAEFFESPGPLVRGSQVRREARLQVGE